ncbi:MAG: choice-of-anchor tandem repeat GloVer-containing protein [Terriglobales bacterium]
MTYEREWLGLRGFGIALLLSFACTTFVAAENDVVLHRFHLSDGAYPQGTLIADAQQNLYGVTSYGGNGDCTVYPLLHSGCGTVFELTRSDGGAWQQTILYEFQGGSDGAFPGAALVFDQAGNLYGTTGGGGLSQACCGTVFELSPPAPPGGDWSEAILYRFTAYTDGAEPSGRLIFDQAGNLYGTAASGGETYDCCGTVFELSPPATGNDWNETTLHIFGSPQGYTDGFSPSAGLTFNKSGALYGTTPSGGEFGWGTVFQLSPPRLPGGRWSESLYSFQGGTSDGYEPYGDLILVRGNLISTTSGGGLYSSGTVFQISSSPAGITESTLYNFQPGYNSDSGLVVDSAFNLYGTTLVGGDGNCKFDPSCGTVFQLVPPPPGGAWTQNIIYEFQGGSDGGIPARSTPLLSGGWLLGVTAEGGGSEACNHDGVDGCGTVFAVRK